MAGSADAALHLVEDQQDAVVVAPPAQPFQPLDRRHDVPALAQHRFHDHGPYGPRRDLCREHPVELAQVAVGRDGHRRQQRLVAVAVARLRGGERGAADRAPVKASPERDHAGTAGRPPGQLERPVHRLGAAVAEEDLRLDEERGEPAQPLGQADRERLVRDNRRVQQRAGLLDDRRDHARMAVAGGRHRDAGREVEVAPAVHVHQVRASSRGHDEPFSIKLPELTN